VAAQRDFISALERQSASRIRSAEVRLNALGVSDASISALRKRKKPIEQFPFYAEADGTLNFLASTFDSASDQLRSGIGGQGPRALTFAPLLESKSIPFTPLMEHLLEQCYSKNR